MQASSAHAHLMIGPLLLANKSWYRYFVVSLCVVAENVVTDGQIEEPTDRQSVILTNQVP